MNKRGEMTTQQIVTMIILIASFAVILFFLAQLDFGSEASNEVCHNSIVVRGSGVSALKAATPLNCEREVVCISEDGSCEKMHQPKVVEVNSKISAYKALAEEVANCWWMFGEGKVDYAGETLIPELYCALCDQVAFDDSVNEIFDGDEFDKKEFYYYMTLANISESQTYSEYLFGTNDLDAISKGAPYGKINTSRQYFILTGMISDVDSWTWAGIGAAVAVVGTAIVVVSGGTAAAAIPAIIGSVGKLGAVGVGGAVGIGGVSYMVAPMVEVIEGKKHVAPSFIEAYSQDFKDLNCEDILTKS